MLPVTFLTIGWDEDTKELTLDLGEWGTLEAYAALKSVLVELEDFLPEVNVNEGDGK